MSALGGKRTFASAFRAARWHKIAPGRAWLKFGDVGPERRHPNIPGVPIAPATQVASAATLVQSQGVHSSPYLTLGDTC
jgi:hypothetical protein